MSLASFLGRLLGLLDTHPPKPVARRWAESWLTVRALARAGATPEHIAAVVHALIDEGA